MLPLPVGDRPARTTASTSATRTALRTCGAQDAVTAHDAERIGRRRFSPERVFRRWARLHGFHVDIIDDVGRLQAERWGGQATILVAIEPGDEDGCSVAFARDGRVGQPLHVVEVDLASRAEAVRFVGALLAVLS